MRNMRGALWALGLAGAAYAWKNRDKLGQRFGGQSQGMQNQLPDYGQSQGSPFSNQSQAGAFGRESGGNVQYEEQPISGTALRGTDV